MQIKIIKTLSSVPALARVEVWGQPGSSCDLNIRRNILQLWKHATMKVTVPSSYKELESENKSEIVSVEESLLDIPEEFLDSITHHLMALPMILPSGKIVDQSTLEKHKVYEANWGRVPCDPFTGKIFTEFCKPVLATGLKARIDKFLVENSSKQELWSVPRTVGKMVRNDTSHTSNKNCTSFRQDDSLGKLPSCSKSITKRPIDIKEDTVKRKMLKLQQDGIANIEKDDSSLAHEDENEDWSLNCALQATLAGLPKYTVFNGHAPEVKTRCCTTPPYVVAWATPAPTHLTILNV
ncbi:RING finger protein 37 [Blattella germanica]|nr:RING finger protein 37 [Blattella germanica]